MRIHFRQATAFTLIELLIVVAIIAILAAIAVPNFLEAQTRSKVSRVKADLRSLRTALEGYCVDTNTYPPENWPNYALTYTAGLHRLTTPISYISTMPYDVFSPQFGQVGTNPMTYEYTYFRPTGTLAQKNKWILVSFGPDRVWDGAEYDPTNGSVSKGNISIRQAYSDSVDNSVN
jgi:type II secretion system protein G